MDYQAISPYLSADKTGLEVVLPCLFYDYVTFRSRDDLSSFDDELEIIGIEIEKECYNTVSNIIILLIYRVPGSSIESFSDKMSLLLDTIARKENKLCYLMGDLNIDLIKHDTHQPTSDFLDLMYTHRMIPLIRKPTRVTAQTYFHE